MGLIFISDIILTGLALIFLVIASLVDLKKREVANWIPFFLIIVALAIRTIVSVIIAKNFLSFLLPVFLFFLFLIFFFLFSKEIKDYFLLIFIVVFIIIGVFLYQQFYLTSAFLVFSVFFIFLSLFYYSRLIGGADVKILLALAIIFSTTPSFLNFNYGLDFLIFPGIFSFLQNMFIFDFITNCLIVGFFYGLIFSAYLAIKNKKRFSKEFFEINKKNLILKLVFFCLSIISLILSFFQNIFLVVCIFFFFIPYLYNFLLAIESCCLKKYKSWRELTEGDWLIQDVKIGKQVIKKSADGLTKKDILLIKRAGKKVLILEGIPFVPVFLIALIISLIFGNLLFRLLIILI